MPKKINADRNSFIQCWLLVACPWRIFAASKWKRFTQWTLFTQWLAKDGEKGKKKGKEKGRKERRENRRLRCGAVTRFLWQGGRYTNTGWNERSSQRTDSITFSRSTSPIIGAKRSSANSRGQDPVKMGRTSISLAILADDSVLPARCRTRASTAVSVARDVKRMPFAVSAISEFPGGKKRSFRKGEKRLSVQNVGKNGAGSWRRS